jgi:hypothetical protein
VEETILIASSQAFFRETKTKGDNIVFVAYEVNAGLVENSGAARREVDAAEDLLVGHVQGEERRRGRHAELGSWTEK